MEPDQLKYLTDKIIELTQRSVQLEMCLSRTISENTKLLVQIVEQRKEIDHLRSIIGYPTENDE